VPGPGHPAKNLKKIKKILCRVPGQGTWQRNLKKIKKNSLSGARSEAPGKEF
jgi:hypothetical protein